MHSLEDTILFFMLTTSSFFFLFKSVFRYWQTAVFFTIFVNLGTGILIILDKVFSYFS